MCIISFSYRLHPDYPLIIAANRDEFYKRPATALHAWQDLPIIAGRDEEQGGTWLGVGKNKRFAAITNYRDPRLAETGTYSRGQIATDFLQRDVASGDFASLLQQNHDLYGPFNVLLFDGQTLIHYNNVKNTITVVPPGVHCVSNATLNTPWPKVARLTQKVATITAPASFDDEALFEALANTEQAIDADLPATGVPFALEKQLSSIFIQMDGYGTRCSTVIKFDGQHYTIVEKTFTNGRYAFCSTATV